MFVFVRKDINCLRICTQRKRYTLGCLIGQAVTLYTKLRLITLWLSISLQGGGRYFEQWRLYLCRGANHTIVCHPKVIHFPNHSIYSYKVSEKSIHSSLQAIILQEKGNRPDLVVRVGGCTTVLMAGLLQYGITAWTYRYLRYLLP